MQVEEKKVDGKKKRIYQVAKEVNVSNEALMDFLLENKVKVRNHMAPVTDEMYTLILQNFQLATEEAEREPDFRKKIQEKKREEEARKELIRQEIDEILEYAKGDIYEELKSAKPEKKEKKAAPSEEKPRTKPKFRKIETETVSHVEVKEGLKPETLISEESKSPADTVPEQASGITQQKTEDQKAQDKPKRHLRRLPKIELPADDKAKSEFIRDKRKRIKERLPVDDEESGALPAPARKKKRKKKKKKTGVQIDAREIEASIKETFARMTDSTKRRRYKKDRIDEEVEVDTGNIIHTTEFCSVAELAGLMNVEPTEVIQACIGLGLLVSINQRLDKDTIVMVADEFSFDVRFVSEYGIDALQETVAEVDEPDQMEPRPPVVTIMGHVDHGKTSLLDVIRESNIIAGEAGEITQHIGAYEVTFKDKHITFLDTPGHEAFTAMRARGAQVTDIVVLVVAADDSVMPQTIEAINHAKAAAVSIVVAINKMDKPGANPDRIKKELSDHDVLVESWGGKVQIAEVSAKTGEGVEHLLELILLEAELLELKANPHASPKGVLVEVKMDRGRGTVGTVLVQRGTLHIGDIFIAGQFNGRVRAMLDERNHPIHEAPPSTPVQVLGFTATPQAGDPFVVVANEQEAREISLKRQQLRREQSFRQQRRLTLDQISKRIAEGEVKELSIILKADVDGSVEVLSDSIMELCCEDVGVRIIHKGVGAITESDVLLAEASQAVILGFHVSPTTKARELAIREEVDIRLYKIIYEVIKDVKLALSGLLEPDVSEEVIGQIEIRDIFKASKVGTIAGCHVLSGRISRNSQVRLIRDGKPVYDGKISTLKRFKDDVKEVVTGYECGLTLENYNDIKVGDILEAYKLIETARSIE